MIWQWAATAAIGLYILGAVSDDLFSRYYWADKKGSDRIAERWEAVRNWSYFLCLGAIVTGIVSFIWWLA